MMVGPRSCGRTSALNEVEKNVETEAESQGMRSKRPGDGCGRHTDHWQLFPDLS